MIQKQYVQKIDRYLSKEEGLPLIVDVQNSMDLNEIIEHYHVGSNVLLQTSNFCSEDGLPLFDNLLNQIILSENALIVTGVTAFLKLFGEQKVRSFIREVLNLSIKGHAIILTFQCGSYLNITDPRLSRRIIKIEGELQKTPNIVFADPNIPLPKSVKVIHGINKFSEIEDGDEDNIYVITSNSKELFPHALYSISSLRSAYDAIVLKDSSTKTLQRSLGTEEQWNYALGLFTNKKSWADVIDCEFISHKALDSSFSNYVYYSEQKQWLYFIALKMFGGGSNWCLRCAASKSINAQDLPRQIYRCLLDKDISDSDFWSCYDIRKTTLKQMHNPSSELSSYCKIVLSKGRDSIYYLTDNTQKEQETIFAFLDKYGTDNERIELEKIIQRIYPDLYAYLKPYRFSSDLLNQYFQDYKYQKVINKIFPEFEKEVEEQAEKREYSLILSPRSTVIESLDKKDSQLYFMDAMGVEYLGYIVSICHDLKLLANIKVCRAELPSITSRNKEFVDCFTGLSYPVVFNKELDDIKHHGKYDYDFYKNTKLPIHLIKELEVIKSVLTKIKDDLSEGKAARIFMISDHGSSRLAVLYDKENIWEMSEKGEHSGRCCPKSDIDSKPDFVADAGDFWALANYDRFKGGRKANVEVHGGATLEEICVPIIELTYMSSTPEIILMALDKTALSPEGIPIIEVSFRKKAALKVFSTAALQNLSIVVNDVSYEAVPIDANYYQVDMPELKKQGTYFADVYSGNNLMAEKLQFIVRKEGQSEKELL